MSEKRKRRAAEFVNTPKTVQPAGEDSYYTYKSTGPTYDLVELLYRLLANWKLIACSALIFAILSGAYTVFCVTPMYEASSTIYVLNRSDSAINFSDLQIGTALTKDYIKVFDMWEVHEEVISNLNLPYTYDEMRDMLTITNDPDTRMLDITVSSPDANEAAVIANEYAKVASQYIADTMSTDKPNVMSVALPPANPVSPSKAKNILLGFILGTALASGYVALLFLMDDKYKTAEDIKECTGFVTLAVVPIETTEDKKGSGRRR